MSLKPKKFSELRMEQEELKKKMQKKKKEINYELPHYTYIVREGTKTEPYYIESIAKNCKNIYSEKIEVLIGESYRKYRQKKRRVRL